MLYIVKNCYNISVIIDNKGAIICTFASYIADNGDLSKLVDIR